MYAKVVRLVERFGMRRVVHAIAMCELRDVKAMMRAKGMARVMLLVIAESN